MEISRPVYNQTRLNEDFGVPNEDDEFSLGQLLRKHVRMPTWQSSLKVLVSLFPILSWLPKYHWKSDIVPDILAGITVGIMNIPQGMAYGMLAGLPPVYGLYTSLFPAILYAIFGTSRNISVGTFAIVSLVVGSTLSNYGDAETSSVLTTLMPINCSLGDPNCIGSPTAESVQNMGKISAAATLTFLVGIAMTIFGFLRLGFLASYLSDQLVQGLTTGAAVLVLTSQVPYLFGLPLLPEPSAPFDIVRYYIQVCKNLPKTNWIVVVMSIICIALLYINKEYVNARFRKTFKFPLPAELLLVIIGTVISNYLSFEAKHQIEIVGQIPVGLPTPSFPAFSNVFQLIPSAFIIAVITFSMSMSMSKIFAKKHGYPVRANQEWLAYGFTSLICGCLSCHCIGASMSRSAVQEGQGGKTQLASLVGAVLILLVLLFLAHLFATLPTCILASIIVVALKSMFDQAKVLPRLWRESKIDFIIWVVSFLAVVLLNISYGLLASVIVALLTVIFRSQWPQFRVLGRLGDTNEYEGLGYYALVSEIPNVLILRFEAPLYFANTEFFKSRILRSATSNVTQTGKVRKSDSEFSIATLESKTTATTTTTESEAIRTIIIDLSSVPYIDLQGIQTLREVFEELRKAGIQACFAGCRANIINMLTKAKLFDKVPKDAFYISIHDAASEVLRAANVADCMLESVVSGVTVERF